MLKPSYENKEDYYKIKEKIKYDKDYTYWDIYIAIKHTIFQNHHHLIGIV